MPEFQGGATEKYWSKRSSDFQLQETRKKTVRAITPVVEAVCVPAYLALPGSLQANQLYHLHAQLSLGQNCHRQKKPCIYVRRVASVVSNPLQPCRLWPASLLCQGGVSPGKNTGTYWPMLLLLSCFSRVQLRATLWTAAHQAPPSTGFSRQEYWSGLRFPSPVLASTGCHTLLEHYIPCCPSCQLP